MDRIDFRSDTVTWPTPAMREAMASAPVGDDVMGEDPTVRQLEALAAERTGKEAALFVSSGTAGNLIATLSHANRGDEAILGKESHVFQWEVGGISSIGGIMPHTLPTDSRGRMHLDDVEAAVRIDDVHLPRTRLVLVENSFGGRGGAAIEPDYFDSIRAIADRHHLAIHMDGARLFNAATRLKLSAATLCRSVDSVTFCLSKGLCAPVGSVLCGDHAFIAQARRMRKSLGGGMRQAGILAAAGILALDEMVLRLDEDHRNARRLANRLAAIDGIEVDVDAVETNIVHFGIGPNVGMAADELCKKIADEHNVLIGSYPPSLLRAVTHYWVGEREVDLLADAVHEIVARARSR